LNVFLTFDVEVGVDEEIGCCIYGGGHGLPYVLEACRKYDVRATFFVEAMGATRWGADYLKEICSLIMSDGHEIQLHIHPAVAVLPGFCDELDVMWRIREQDQAMLIENGLAILVECGCNRPVAFRAGSLAANEATLRAMETNGIYIGSNRDLDLKTSIESKLNDSFPIINDISVNGKIVDLPVSVFKSPLPWLDGQYRHLEICAVSVLETKSVLTGFKNAGYSCVTFLSHPSEFFTARSGGYRPIRKNCRRLEWLLQMVSSDDDMRVRTVSECVLVEPLPADSPAMVSVNPAWSLMRVLEQGISRCL